MASFNQTVNNLTGFISTLTTSSTVAAVVINETVHDSNNVMVGTIGDDFTSVITTSDISEDLGVDFGDDFFPTITFPSVIIALALTIVIFGTVVGNILVCVAVCLVRKLRRPCNYLLVSLAVSDLCVAILVMPIALLYEISGNWSFGPLVCNLWVSFDVLSCTASILNLCMISVDRYYAITKPLEYGVKRTPKRMIFCVFLVWLGAACISLPPLLILGNEHEEMTEDGRRVPRCTVCQNFGYQIYATLGSFYIPLTVMMVVYYKIFRAARRIVLDEKKAQSHLEAHCYLEISVKNGGAGPPENKIASQGSSPANAIASRIQHRSSSASTNTTCSMDKPSIARCFRSRRSNESQCPMLSTKMHNQQLLQQNNQSKSPVATSHQNMVEQRKPSNKTSAASHLLASLKPSSPSVGSGHVTSGGSGTTAHPNQKKLRFQLAKERKASTTLGIIMSAFTVCWLPFFVLALVRPFLKDENAIPHLLSSLFLWLGYANSLLNPIIYATLNRDFRKPFQEILYFRCSNLNHMMREEFYHSQYGDPDQQTTYCGHINTTRGMVGEHTDYDEGVEYIEADREGSIGKSVESTIVQEAAAHESFL